ncbi:MAG: HlyD family type I secretion periplasmic adaptor subunit [Halieaceae bacterium]|nr:HlyD family type I secretion periplasmic adaptor subunit [Halieaceae bacterium]
MNLLWFLNASDEASVYRSSLRADLKRPRRVMWVTFVALGTFGTWAYHSEIDQVARAMGSVIPSSNIQIIQSRDGGVLEALPVKAGDLVEKGQVIAQFNVTEAQADYREARAKAASLHANLARLQAEVFERTPDFGDEYAEYQQFQESQLALMNKRQSALNEDLEAINGMLRLIREEIAMNEPLVVKGDVSKTEILRLQRQEAELVAKHTSRRNEYFQEVQSEFAKAEEEYERVRQAVIQRERQLSQTTLRAPVKGLIKRIRVTTEGGVIRPGEDVLEIVPVEDDLLIEAKLPPADIGFVTIGQEATVKIDAYDFTIYGSLKGTVSYISADTIEEQSGQNNLTYYSIQVRTSGKQFSGRPDDDLQILPGMTATVEVQTGKNTILNYLLKPITKTISESMGER